MLSVRKLVYDLTQVRTEIYFEIGAVVPKL